MTEKLTKRQLQAQRTRENLYDTAVELFKTHHYDEVSIKDICNKAGVSVGVFYHYYDSKPDIFFEGYRWFDKHLTEFFAENEAEDPLENIRLVLRRYFEAVNDYGDIYRRIFLRVELAYQPEYTTNMQRDMDKLLFKYINEAISNEQLFGDEYEIHRNLKIVMKGVSYTWALNNGDFDVIEVGLQRYEMTMAYFKTNPSL